MSALLGPNRKDGLEKKILHAEIASSAWPWNCGEGAWKRGGRYDLFAGERKVLWRGRTSEGGRLRWGRMKPSTQGKKGGRNFEGGKIFRALMKGKEKE